LKEPQNGDCWLPFRVYEVREIRSTCGGLLLWLRGLEFKDSRLENKHV